MAKNIQIFKCSSDNRYNHGVLRGLQVGTVQARIVTCTAAVKVRTAVLATIIDLS
jgi:hypothetical protein